MSTCIKPKKTISILCLALLAIIVNGEDSGVVQKTTSTLEDCARSCLEEKTIKCRYFKFINVSGTCLMSGSEHPDIKDYLQKEAISGSTSSHPPTRQSGSDDVKQLMRKVVLTLKDANEKQNNKINKFISKISFLESQYKKLEGTRDKLGEVTKQLEDARTSKHQEIQLLAKDKLAREKTLKLLTSKLRGAAQQSSGVAGDLNNIKDTQMTFKTEIEALRQAENDMYGNVVQINRKTTKLNSDISNIKNMDNEIKKEISEMRRTDHNKDLDIEKLNREVLNNKNEGASIKPEVVAIERNQRTLAKALETIAHKVENFEGFVNNFQKSLDNYGHKLTVKTGDDKEFRDKVKVMNDVLKETKVNVGKLLNPQSSLNMERSQGLLKMKSDINILSSSMNTLKQDAKSSKLDMTNLVKDLANVQLSSQDMKNQLGIVVRESKQLQSEMVTIQESEKQKPSVVEVAQMHKRVLVALKSAESKESRLLEKIQQYQQAVSEIAERVQKSQDTNARVQRLQIKHDETLKHLADKLATLNAKLEGIRVPLKLNMDKGGVKASALINELKNVKNELEDLEGSVSKLRKKSKSTKAIPEPETQSVADTSDELNEDSEDNEPMDTETKAEAIEEENRPKKHSLKKILEPRPTTVQPTDLLKSIITPKKDAILKPENEPKISIKPLPSLISKGDDAILKAPKVSVEPISKTEKRKQNQKGRKKYKKRIIKYLRKKKEEDEKKRKERMDTLNKTIKSLSDY